MAPSEDSAASSTASHAPGPAVFTDVTSPAFPSSSRSSRAHIDLPSPLHDFPPLGGVLRRGEPHQVGSGRRRRRLRSTTGDGNRHDTRQGRDSEHDPPHGSTDDRLGQINQRPPTTPIDAGHRYRPPPASASWNPPGQDEWRPAANMPFAADPGYPDRQRCSREGFSPDRSCGRALRAARYARSDRCGNPGSAVGTRNDRRR